MSSKDFELDTPEIQVPYALLVPPRIRMSVEARREQLLNIGVELLATRPYDDLWIEEVAERAGVSRGLLYHYFPTKRHFVAAVVSTESERLLQLIKTEPQQSVVEQLHAGLDAYLAYVEGHQQSFVMLHEGALTGDTEIRGIIKAANRVQEERILDALREADESDADYVSLAEMPSLNLIRAAVRGWMAFTVEVCLQWIADPSLTRPQVREVCAHALLTVAVVAAAQSGPDHL